MFSAGASCRPCEHPGAPMQAARLAFLALGAALTVGCGDNADSSSFSVNSCAQVTSGQCVQIRGGDAAALQTAANSIDASTTIVLGKGTFNMTNQLTLRSKGAHLIGQGMDQTTLNFKTATAQGNGIDVIGDDFLVQALTVIDAAKDGIRVEASKGVVYRRVHVTWSTPSLATN